MILDTAYVEKFIDGSELKLMQPKVRQAHEKLEKRCCPGADYLGWLHLPSSYTAKALSEIEEAASLARKSSDIFIVIGIGGSYLGSRAAIEFLRPSYKKQKPLIAFSGNNLDPCRINRLLDSLKDKEVCINVISKSGTTTEPAIAFRIIKNWMQKRYSANQLKKRIICTTTKNKGSLYETAKKNGYRLLYIPEDVGGRFSVLTPVGLLPMAVAGIDIRRLIKGACGFEAKSGSADIDKNPAYLYAVLRNLLYKKGKDIEIISSFHIDLLYILEWCKQLLAESEGKESKGIFPATAVFSTDLHSIGQLIQQGKRNIFETFIVVKKSDSDIKIPREKENTDRLNYLSGRGVDFVNRTAYKGTALAHLEGGIPNMTIRIDERSPYCLGELFYFFQRAVAVSGYLLGINPFDQPGVEAYKKNMFKLLGKPS